MSDIDSRDRLLPFAVRILKHEPGGPRPVGTGTLVGPGTLLTCAHVYEMRWA